MKHYRWVFHCTFSVYLTNITEKPASTCILKSTNDSVYIRIGLNKIPHCTRLGHAIIYYNTYIGMFAEDCISPDFKEHTTLGMAVTCACLYLSLFILYTERFAIVHAPTLHVFL